MIQRGSVQRLLLLQIGTLGQNQVEQTARLKSIHIWVILVYLGTGLPKYVTAYWLPLILKIFGFRDQKLA